MNERFEAEIAVKNLLEYLGQDTTRDGLRDTPKRVVKAFEEMTAGYKLEPKDVLGTVFEESFDQMIVLRGIEFNSLCEHHLLPFIGTAHVAYIPGKIVGISKLARLVDCFARRFQIQERMTMQIAEAVEEVLEAKGVGVQVVAKHLCMTCRGVQKQNTEMVTSVLLGAMKDEGNARSEFLNLCQK